VTRVTTKLRKLHAFPVDKHRKLSVEISVCDRWLAEHETLEAEQVCAHDRLRCCTAARLRTPH
jgi:hypothetical protein